MEDLVDIVRLKQLMKHVVNHFFDLPAPSLDGRRSKLGSRITG
jgi:hypothetical protein